MIIIIMMILYILLVLFLLLSSLLLLGNHHCYCWYNYYCLLSLLWLLYYDYYHVSIIALINASCFAASFDPRCSRLCLACHASGWLGSSEEGAPLEKVALQLCNGQYSNQYGSYLDRWMIYIYIEIIYGTYIWTIFSNNIFGQYMDNVWITVDDILG